MQHDIPHSHTHTQHQDMGQSRGQAHTVGAGEDDSGGKQLSGCRSTIGAARNRATRRTRSGSTGGGSGGELARKYPTEDSGDQPLDSVGGDTRNHGEQAWGVTIQILILALLLTGWYMGVRDPRGVEEEKRWGGLRTTFSFSDELSSAHHKTTASWALHVLDREMDRDAGSRSTGTDFEWRDAFLGACTAKLVDRRPLTAWEQSVLQAQMCYEAERRRVEGLDGASGGLRRAEGETASGSWNGQSVRKGAEPGSTGVEQERELGDNRSGSTGIEQERQLGDNRSGEDTIRIQTHRTARGWGSVETETPAKRQRLGNVCGTSKAQEVREEAASTQWEKRQVLTVLCREVPLFLDVSEVIKLIGTPLTTLIGAIKHMAKRAVPVKAGGTEIEAIAAPTIADVLESSWKWDGQGDQPPWEPDSVKFKQFFPTYQAWHTLAYRPSVLAQMVSLPPEHRVFTELGDRIQASMRAGWPLASSGPVPDAPRPLMQTDKTSSVRRWYLHTLAEASLYGAPHDGRLHKALRQELQGTFDPYNLILWIGPGWPSEGRMESVRVFTGEEAEQRVNV